jgi:hypothetical protein
MEGEVTARVGTDQQTIVVCFLSLRLEGPRKAMQNFRVSYRKMYFHAVGNINGVFTCDRQIVGFLHLSTKFWPLKFARYWFILVRNITLWLLQRADVVEAGVTSRGSRKFNPRDGLLQEEDPGAWRPERTERRQPSRHLLQQKDRSSASSRGPSSDATPPATDSRRRASNRRAQTQVSDVELWKVPALALTCRFR